MKETIDRDFSKYLESRQMKEGCDSRAEIRGGGGAVRGEKVRLPSDGETAPNIFSKMITSI